MTKPTQKKLYPLLLLILIFIIQVFVCDGYVYSTCTSVYFKDLTYIAQIYKPDIPDIPHVNAGSFIKKADDVPACIACRLFDYNKKNFLYSDTCLYRNDILSRHLDFQDNHIDQSIQKKNILYQSSDDPLPLI